VRRPSVALAAALALGCAFAPARAALAADQWVSRPLTLPSGTFAFDAGLGVSHLGVGSTGLTGAGANFEAAVGITSHFQLGVRTGIRGGTDGKVLGSDAYGRLYDSLTFGVGLDTVANPEIALRGSLARTEIVEVALDGRTYLPIEPGTKPGILIGVPFLFHLARVARLDVGAYVPFITTNPIQSGVVVPVDVWFQPTRKFWLGPLTGLRFRKGGTDLRMGGGLGYQAASFVDFKAQLVFPQVNQDDGTREFGFGVGVQLRIE
jgi:hypothetical protein